VWLEQHAIDLLELDGADTVAHGLEQGADAEVASPAEVALGRADDETEASGENVVCGSAAASSSR
jgi:hypothetical protein